MDDNIVVNFTDIQLIVLAFLENFNSITVERADLDGCLPNGVINFADIQLGVLAFLGNAYEATGCPIPCGQSSQTDMDLTATAQP